MKKIVFTVFFCMLCILPITIIIDASEKIDDFMEAGIPLRDLFTGYYSGFALYIANMLFPLFTLIGVVLVTMKMNRNNEITAILSSGVSFNRLLRPFLLGTGVIVAVAFIINIFFLPEANYKRIYFENNYTVYASVRSKVNIEVSKGTIVSYRNFNVKRRDVVNGLWIDQFNTDSTGKQRLVSTLKSDNAYCDSLNNWSLKSVLIREYTEKGENMRRVASLDTTLSITLNDLGQRTNIVNAMTLDELDEYREKERAKGSKIVPFIEIEMYTRFATPLSLFIISFLGVCISISPTRGKTGGTILIGIASLAIYFVMNRFTSVAATNAGLNPFIAVWLPNVALLLFGIYIYIRTPK